MSRPAAADDSTTAALQAFRRGYQAIPIRDGGKRPYGASWTHIRWESAEQVKASFDRWREEGASGIGLLLGEPSGGLVDVDLDHQKAWRLRDHFLPPTPMQTGRAGRPRSHRWYIATENLPGTRRYKMPSNEVSVELRSDGGQTVIPPSIHPSGEPYRWEGTPWGGRRGPAKVDGRKLSVQVALLALGAVLLDAWPKQGSRHEAYLALAGGLLRFGEDVHPYWERNLPVLISALADVTRDEDGADTRVAEVMGSTLKRLREGGKVVGFPSLAEIIGVDHAEAARRMAREVESLAGFTAAVLDSRAEIAVEPEEPLVSTLPPEDRDPMEERITSWDSIDLDPWLSGQIVMPEPSILRRSDGRGLFYPGRVNSLYGPSESAKSWLALVAALQEIDLGERVLYLDFEDEPAGTIARLRALGAGDDDIKNQFRYVRPEGPLAEMQRYQHGTHVTDEGAQSSAVFRALLDTYDPTLIIADGMTVLYGLHGHDTNSATGTDVITTWLKTLCRGGRTTVLVIDHTGKSGGAGSSPIGAHHKVAMVQGTAIRADVLRRPMPGAVGTISLAIFKDRPGAVRQYATQDSEQVAAIVTLDSTQEGITRVSIDPADPDDMPIGGTPEQEQELQRLARQDEMDQRVLALFSGDLERRISSSEAATALNVSLPTIYGSWARLRARGLLVAEGSTRGRRYRLSDPMKGETGDGSPEP